MKDDIRLPILIVNNEQYHSTWESKVEAERCCERLNRYIPDKHYHIKPFYVDIHKVKPRDRLVIEWKKKEGYSIWFKEEGNNEIR